MPSGSLALSLDQLDQPVAQLGGASSGFDGPFHVKSDLPPIAGDGQRHIFETTK